MKKLTKTEGIGVFAGIALLTYVFFSGPLLALFNISKTQVNMDNQELPQTGLVKVDLVVGTGDVAQAGDNITAHYVGKLPNGQVFDSSRDRDIPIQFTLGTGQVIKGWDEGVSGMRVGGKRLLKIAPDYGYGDRPVGTIPANSTLVFEVELLKVERP